MIFTSSYELRLCLVVIGQIQPFSTAKVLSNREDNEPKVLSSNQEDNKLLATLRESFNIHINLGLDLALQDPILLQYFIRVLIISPLKEFFFLYPLEKQGSSLLVDTLLALAFIMNS
jgi:hypothetical protein